jgi:competence protein ComEC
VVKPGNDAIRVATDQWADDSMLRIHFLNVGHGECTIIAHPSGRLTMVDINNSQEYDQDSLNAYLDEKRSAQPAGGLLRLAGNNALIGNGLSGAGLLGNSPFGSPRPGVNLLFETTAREDAKREIIDPIRFLQENYPNQSLFRFILTHPDLDHMRGLKRLYETIGFANFWDVAHTKLTPNFKSDADRDEWAFYQHLRSGGLGLGPRMYHRGDQLFAFGRDEHGALGGDGIEILSPTPALIQYCNAAKKSNDLSYVLRVWHTGRSLMLTGDIEEVAWNQLASAYGAALKTDFMTASHHGRDSGYHLPTLQLIKPNAIVVSVGRKPSTDASRKYCANCASVFSTRYYGNLELHIFDDGTHRWFAERNGGK